VPSIEASASIEALDGTGSVERWGIILSGGNGTRLRDLVYQRRADYLPKQYLNFLGKRTMLEHTLRRAEKLIPASKLLVIVAKEHLHYEEVRRQLASRPQECVVIQPENKDTGAGVLLPLMHVRKRAPAAVVAVLPSDHYILEEDLFMRHVERAFELVESNPSRVVLLGIEPNEADPEYGYILPGGNGDNPAGRTVEMFVEKPSAEAAAKIINKGALWNTLVLVAHCETLLQAIQHATPDLYRAFEPIQGAIATPDEKRVIERAYQNLRAVDFSKGVLETLSLKDRQNLRVLPVRGITWKDWGTSDRLSKTLRQLGARDPEMPEPLVSHGRSSRLAERSVAAVRRVR
jgi:mannose-1-phosphate guanylyltransferase